VLLAKGLPRERFRVEVAALTRLGPYETELEAAGIPITLVGKRHKLDPLALGRLVGFLKHRNFDVVQTWLFAANCYGRIAALWAQVPVIIATEMAVDLWKAQSQLAIDRWLGRRTDRVVGNSRAVVDFYHQAGIPAERLEMIYSGIGDEEPPQVDPAEVRASLGLPVNAPLVLFAGRLAAQKGVGHLLDALDLLQHVRPELCALIVGDGPLRAHLENSAHAYRLDASVRFLGHREDVPRLMAASDLIVLPSLYEGLPNVVLEAMRARKPVVATAAPGTTEVVDDGKTGLLVPTLHAPALAEAIRKLIQNPALARRMGEAGRARVEATFRLETMVARFADLYEQLAKNKRQTVP
jgi:glycosyltransferase involved in cell wall biosynthesis